jgi:multimeric flavodoxin WrbA
MKVLLINGSPHAEGCTYTAIAEIASSLEAAGIATQIYHIPGKPMIGCTACRSCTDTGVCAFGDDGVNEVISLMRGCDGLVLSSPVYYASPNGAALSFYDRLFYAAPPEVFAFKPCAVAVSARRGGTTAAIEVLDKYPTIAQMPLVSSQYWPMVHGNTPEEVRRDLEGMQVMRRLGRNMAWLLQCIEAGREAGLELPHDDEEPMRTSFIR